MLIPETSDGRVIYALPWLGGSLIGTTDVAVDSPDADPSAPQEDVDFLLGEIEKYLPGASSLPVLSAFTGIRPLVKATPDVDTAQLARSHRIVVSESGVVTITGGKWTTARLMADHTVTRAVEVGGLGRGRGATDELRLRGFDRSHGTPTVLELPIANPDLLYGTDVNGIRDLEKRWPKLKTPISENLPYRMSHAVYAVREEMAVKLEDVLARRTRSLFLNAVEASAAAKSVAEAVETHGGFEPGWATSEMARFPTIASQFRSAS
jgi:glycerol-3-phosphate dehydrogenase